MRVTRTALLLETKRYARDRKLVRLWKGHGTSANCYRCSVPGLAEFAVARLHGIQSLIKETMKYE